MRSRSTRLVSALTLAALLVGMMLAVGSASSHREAPLIANDPQLDNTDLYAFIDPNDSSRLVVVSLYYPFEMPAGFPNGYTFSDSALYTINVDRNGDGKPDLRYGFDFETQIRNQETFYSNVTLAGDLKVTSASDPDLNIVQTYDVLVSNGSRLPAPNDVRMARVLVRDAYTSPNRVGPATHDGQDFAAIMQTAVATSESGISVWAGQADDPFFADLGAIWDLAQLRTITGANGGVGIDGLADMNAQAIVMSIPVSTVIGSGRALTGPGDPRAAVGIWAANYRMATQTLRPTIDTTDDEPNARDFASNQARYSGAWVQVSRLGMPLANEVILTLDQKDRWNRTEPATDAQYIEYYENSHLAVLLNALFGTPGVTTGRDDIRTIFLTGIPGLTMVANSANEAVPSDMLRINLAIADSEFPNGRDLDDDIVDVSLSVVGLSDGTLGGLVTSGLSDGVSANDVPFQSVFPYLGVPHDGYAYDPDAAGD